MGNSGPYLLYAYARTNAILTKLKEHLAEEGEAEHLQRVIALFETDAVAGNAAGLRELKFGTLAHELEHDLIGMLHDYPTLMEQAAQAGTPVDVCRYAYEMSKSFSSWYQNKECSVLKSEPEHQLARMALVQAIGAVLKHALGLIGVQTLEKM